VNSLAGEYTVEPLSAHHDRAAFSCGVDALDRYVRQQAGQDMRRHIAAVYVLRQRESGAVAGFYTLANTAIQFAELPPTQARRLPRYPQVPATLLGRLAVHVRHRQRGLGEFLLFDAMHRCLESSRTSASFALVVDAKDEAAKRFYLHYGFKTIPGVANRMFLPMQDIERDLS